MYAVVENVISKLENGGVMYVLLEHGPVYTSSQADANDIMKALRRNTKE